MSEHALNLDQTHPTYDADKIRRDDLRVLFEGSEPVKALTETYLTKFDNETDAGYAARLVRAVYDNYMKMVIDARQALIWRKDPTREGMTDEDLEDVDNQGSPANEFFSGRTEDAQVEGVDFVLVDQSSKPGEVVTRADEQAAGMRTFFMAVPANSVLDWEIGEDNRLNWVVIATTRTKERETWGEPVEEIHQRLCWTRKEWAIYETETKTEGETSTWKLIDTGTHPVGEVPLVPFYGERIEAMRGKSLIAPIKDHVVAIYNKYSDRDTAERLANNPKLWMISTEKPTIFDAGSDKGFHMVARESVQSSIGYLEPAGTGLEASRLSERGLVQRIFELSLRQAKRDSVQVQAEGSMKEERASFNASIAAVSGSYERAEKQCWEFWQKWDGKTEKIVIEYNKDFDDKAITDRMISAFSSMVADDQIQLETFLEILKEGEVLPASVEIGAEVKALELKADESAEKAFEAIRRSNADDENEQNGVNPGSANREP